jgi:hypothetical protein
VQEAFIRALSHPVVNFMLKIGKNAFPQAAAAFLWLKMLAASCSKVSQNFNSMPLYAANKNPENTRLLKLAVPPT